MSRGLTHTGHHILADGSVLRLDVECGAFVASWYTPQSVLKACAYGSLAQMAVVVAAWVTAFDLSTTSPSGGDQVAVSVLPPGGDQLKESA